MTLQTLPVGNWIPAPCFKPQSTCFAPKHYSWDGAQFHTDFQARVTKVAQEAIEVESVRFYSRRENQLGEASPVDDIGNHNAKEVYDLYQSGKVTYPDGRLTVEKIEQSGLGWVIRVRLKECCSHKTQQIQDRAIIASFDAGKQTEFLEAIEKLHPPKPSHPEISFSEFKGGIIRQ